MSDYIPPKRAKEIMREELLNLSGPDLFQDIIDFHKQYKLYGNPVPGPLCDELKWARVVHLNEEYYEYVTAVVKDDMLNALDALVDLVYVALGTAYFHGFDFNEAWRRVHEANMRKVRVDAAENSKRGTQFDVVKPEGWVGPDLEDLV